MFLEKTKQKGECQEHREEVGLTSQKQSTCRTGLWARSAIKVAGVSAQLQKQEGRPHPEDGANVSRSKQNNWAASRPLGRVHCRDRVSTPDWGSGPTWSHRFLCGALVSRGKFSRFCSTCCIQ